jgi:hypothetical protein
MGFISWEGNNFKEKAPDFLIITITILKNAGVPV